MSKKNDRIAIVADWLEEQGFTAAEIENVRDALQSPPAWFQLAVVSRVQVGFGGEGWNAEIVGTETGNPPIEILEAFEAGSPLQLGLREGRPRKRR